MKEIKKLRFKDINNTSIDANTLSELTPKRMEHLLGGYGCQSDVCSSNWSGATKCSSKVEAEAPCGSSSICANYTCTSGIAG